MKGRPEQPAFYVDRFSKRKCSSAIHKTKPDGTTDIAEHRTAPFVVGAGNANM
jgi:hypothetical protein